MLGRGMAVWDYPGAGRQLAHRCPPWTKVRQDSKTTLTPPSSIEAAISCLARKFRAPQVTTMLKGQAPDGDG